MSTGNCRHDRTVDHSKLGDAVNHKLRVDHGIPVRVRPHLASAALVMHLHGQPLHATSPVLVRAVLQMPTARHGARTQRRPIFLESGRFVQFYYHFYALDNAIQVDGFIEEVRPDHGFRIGVSVPQPNLNMCSPNNNKYCNNDTYAIN